MALALLALLLAPTSALGIQVIYHYGWLPPTPGQASTQWIAQSTRDPSMSNFNTGTDKRIMRFRNGVGQTGDWIIDARNDPAWTVLTSPFINLSWTCRNRSTGWVQVQCSYIAPA